MMEPESSKPDETGKRKEKTTQVCIRTHRVGTVTCGATFILYGIMFLVRLALPEINYTFIFRMWPVVLILLGGEILAGTVRKDQEKDVFVYDFPAVLLIIGMLFLTMLLALFDYGLATGRIIWQEGCYYGI